jgi:hypothetical protein
LQVFGHAQVATLEGGLPAWVAAGAPVDTGAPAIPAQAGTEACQGAQKAGAASQPSYKATLDLAQVKDVNQVGNKREKLKRSLGCSAYMRIRIAGSGVDRELQGGHCRYVGGCDCSQHSLGEPLSRCSTCTTSREGCCRSLN